MAGWGLLIAVALSQKGTTALVLPDWKNCQSEYDAADGLAIRCDPVLMVEVTEVDGKPSPSMLQLLRMEGYDAKPHAFKLAGRQIDGLRMTKIEDGVTLVTLAAVVASGKKARSLRCVTAEIVGLEGVCTQAFDFFAGPVVLAEWQAAKSRSPWGRSKPDAKNDAKVRKLVDAAAKSPGSLAPSCADQLVVGPGLWWWLTQADPEQEKIGTKSTAKDANGSYPMRMFQGDAVASFLASKGAAALFKRFAPGKVRAASDGERKVFYAVIPFEIDGVPISVVDRGQTQLLVHLSEGKVSWLELITDNEKQDFVKGP